MKLKKILAVLSAITMTVTVTTGYFPAMESNNNTVHAAEDTFLSEMISSLPLIYGANKHSGDVKTTADGWEYYEEDKSIIINGYSGDSTELVIPDTINEKDVVAISDNAFSDNTKIKSIKLGNVQSIGSEFLSGCTGITEITIPKTVTNTGNWYDGCLQGSSVETVIFEEGIANIPSNICRGASSVKNVVLPEKEDTIDGYAIEDSAFLGTSITSIKLPESLTAIQGSAFRDCAQLTEIVIPDNVDYIGDHCFAGCKRLKSLKLGSKINTLGICILEDCIGITEITIPKTVTNTGDWYDGCLQGSSVETLIIEPGMKKIPEHLARECKTLKTVYLPDTVSEIGDYSFSGCSNLEKLYSNRSSFDFSAYSFEGCVKLDDARCTVLDLENTYLIANSEQTSLNGVINYTLKYKLMPSVASKADNFELQIDVPEGMTLLLDSVQSKNLKIEGEDIEDGIISVDSAEGELRFSARVTEFGDYNISANLNFDYNNSSWEQQIGRLEVDCPDITCYTLEKTNKFEINVYGLSEKGSEVEIYVDDKLVSTVNSNSYTGKYSTAIKLPTKKSGESYSIYASCNDVDSDATTVIYEENQPEIKSVTMVYVADHSNEKLRLDITNVLTEGVSPVINYNPEFPMVFEIEADRNEQIYKLYVTSTKGNSEKKLEAFWNEEKQVWITEGYFDENNHSYIPGALNIEIHTYNCTEKTDTTDITPELQLTPNENTIANSSSEILEKTDTETLEKIVISNGVKSEELHQYCGESDSVIVDGKKVSADDIVKSPSTYGYIKAPYKNSIDGTEYEYYVKPIAGNEIDTNFKAGYELFEDMYGFSIIESGDDLESRIISQVWDNTMPEALVEITFGKEAAEVYGDVGTFVSLGGTIVDFYDNYTYATSEEGRDVAKLMYAYSVTSLCIGTVISTVNPVAGILWGIANGLIEEHLQDQFDKHYKNSGNLRLVIDPSGIVYEAVKSNPIYNAEMTIYYLDSETNEPVLWNAEDYEQLNPIYTNFDGAYAWDVPEGKWKVVCELEGYETQETEWLDVPPVQTEVNFSLISYEVPSIKSVEYVEEGIAVSFTKFMDITTITEETITTDTKVEYSIEPQLYDESDKYTDKFIICGDFASVDEITVSASADCVSYAGVNAKANSLTATSSNPPVDVEPGESDGLSGDANGDNAVDLKDVVIIRRYVAGGWDVEIDTVNADVNADNIVDLKDVVLTRRYIAGGWDVELK